MLIRQPAFSLSKSLIYSIITLMNPLKIWQSILAVLWIFAFLGGGYFIYNSFIGGADCSVYVQGGAQDCGASQTGALLENDFSRYDMTSPLLK